MQARAVRAADVSDRTERSRGTGSEFRRSRVTPMRRTWCSGDRRSTGTLAGGLGGRRPSAVVTTKSEEGPASVTPTGAGRARRSTGSRGTVFASALAGRAAPRTGSTAWPAATQTARSPPAARDGECSKHRAASSVSRCRDAAAQRAAATRQIVLPTSSAISSAPRPSTATPTGRPRARSSASRKPVSRSRGAPAGLPDSNGT